MTPLILTLLLAAYVLVGAFLAGVCEMEPVDACMMGMAWPLALVFALGVAVRRRMWK